MRFQAGAFDLHPSELPSGAALGDAPSLGPPGISVPCKFILRYVCVCCGPGEQLASGGLGLGHTPKPVPFLATWAHFLLT